MEMTSSFLQTCFLPVLRYNSFGNLLLSYCQIKTFLTQFKIIFLNIKKNDNSMYKELLK